MKTTKFVSSFILFLMLWGGGIMGQAKDTWEPLGTNCPTCSNLTWDGQDVKCEKVIYTNDPNNYQPVNPVNKTGYTLVMQDEFTGALNKEYMQVESYNEKWTAYHGQDWYGYKNLAGTAWVSNNNTVMDWDYNHATNVNGKLELIMDKQANSNVWLTSELVSKMKFRYGYIESKIKIPKGCGLFPAFWLWGKGNGDINLFEFWYNVPMATTEPDGQILLTSIAKKFQFSQYWCDSPPCYDSVPPTAPNFNHTTDARFYAMPMYDALAGGAWDLDLSKDYFIYAVDWSPVDIKFYINNVLIGTVPNHLTKGTNVAFSLIGYDPNNPAQGGRGLNSPIATPNPSKMQVEYVRVYKKNTSFNTLLQDFPSTYCAGTTTTTPSFEDFFPTSSPNTSYKLTVVNQPAIASQRINLTQIWGTNSTGDSTNGPDWGNIWYNIQVPSTTPSGTYTLKLEVRPYGSGPTDTTKLRAYKTIYVNATPPTKPSFSQTWVNNECNCQINLATPQAVTHTWSKNGQGLPAAAFSTVVSSGSYTMVANAFNGCGTNNKTQTLTCVQGTGCNAPVRMSDPHSTQEIRDENLVSDNPILPSSLIGALPNHEIVYPNPLTEETIWVDWGNYADQKATLEIREANGHILHTQVLTQKITEISLPHLQKGTYLCTLHTDTHQHITLLLVKNR